MTTSPPNPTSWQPPAKFRPVQSTVEGITVYAPVDESEKAQAEVLAPTTFKCPQCGATTRYDLAAGGAACEHCGYTEAVKAARVGQQAEELEFTLETVREAEQGWGIERRELCCESCGAVLSVAEKSISATCPFCASNNVNLRQAAASSLRPRFLIPFKVQIDAVRARAREWLGKGWFHPSELGSSAIIDRFMGIYLPFWTFDARITSDWKAEVGYPREERYYDSSDKEWKTRTVIDWRWENGRAEVDIDDLPVVGSSRLSRLILERLYPFHMQDLVAYLPDFLAGWQAQAFDVTLTRAWEEGKAAMREQAKQACNDQISESNVRNFSMTADFADESWRYVLLPVYLASYQFQGKVYQVMANGQTGTIAGQKPVAWWKIWLAIAGLLSPGALLILIGLPLLLVGGVGIFVMILGAILFVPAGIFSYKIYMDAVASEAA